jgi:hypothetical protein
MSAAKAKTKTKAKAKAGGRPKWPKRRQLLYRIARDSRLTAGAKAWFLYLLSCSDEEGKPVWGNQAKMAALICRGSRSVRRYRSELEQLGYITTYRAAPERGPDGRYCRRRSNTYYLHLPPASSADRPAPRRRQRAPYCVVPHRALGHFRSGTSHLAASDGRSTPLRGETTGGSPPLSSFKPSETPVFERSEALDTVANSAIAAARAALRSARPLAG